MTVAAIVVAAGRGERFGGSVPKALVPVAGRPLVVHAVDRVVAAGIDEVVVVHPAGERPAFAAVLADRLSSSVRLVEGGAARSDSVRAGLAALGGEVGRVAVHDAARGLQPSDVIAATVAAVGADVVAAAPALPVTDTLKRVDGPQVVATVDRATLVAVQTPQVVVTSLLRTVHASAQDATDDLGLVEAHPGGGRVVHVPGSPLGAKITYAQDVVVIEALLAAGGMSTSYGGAPPP